MQDSLEDYIRISSNTKFVKQQEPKINKEILYSLERKKHCEEYAQRLVEMLCDGKLQPQIFLKSLNYITPEHYQDIVEERACTQICGYALCGKRLPKMPAKEYHISTKTNKVFDITERKNFCSNYCYQASCHIKKQIDTSPLWLRNNTPNQFNLLPSKDVITQPGIEIDYGIARIRENSNFTSITSFAEVCLEEAEENEDFSGNVNEDVIHNFQEDNLENEKFPENKNNSNDKHLKSILKKHKKSSSNVEAKDGYEEKSESNKINFENIKEEKQTNPCKCTERKENERIVLENIDDTNSKNEEKHIDRLEEKECECPKQGKEKLVEFNEGSENKTQEKENLKNEKLEETLGDPIIRDEEETEDKQINNENLEAKILDLEKSDTKNEQFEANKGEDTENESKSSVRLASKYSKQKKVRFHDSSILGSQPSTSKCNVEPSTSKICEITDLNKSIDELCHSMNIKLPTRGNASNIRNSEIAELYKPVPIDSKRMQSVVQKINNKSKPRAPILIETHKNPEQKKNRPEVIERPPKYTQKIIEKIKTTQEDPNLQIIIDKVKNLEISRHKSEENDKIQTVLKKIKTKEAKTKSPILIETNTNPELIQIQTRSKNIPKIKKPVLSPDFDLIKSCIQKWFTLDTYIFIHGESKVRGILNETVLGEYFEKLKIVELETSQQIRYMNICKKLQLKELAEEKFDSAIVGRKFKPLPDYNKLKSESKDMDLKVKAFFSGNLIEKEQPMSGGGLNIKKEDLKDSNGQEEGVPAVLPLVDVASQNALRRKIYNNAITKYLKNHVHEMDLPESIVQDTQEMIKTFKLEANNITFKPNVWNIIAMVLIIILSYKDPKLKKQLEKNEAVEYKLEIFLNYSDSVEFLAQLENFVINLQNYVEQYITQNVS